MKNFKVWAGALLLAALVAGVTSCSKDETTGITSSSASLKSTDLDTVKTIIFSRDPSSAIGAFSMYGISLTEDTYSSMISSISTGDTSLPYSVYFYNEKIYAYDTTSTGAGCPALILGANVTGYKTGFTGSVVFDTISSVNPDLLQIDTVATLPFVATSAYKFSNGKLKSTVKTQYYTKFIIGNTFQGKADSAQPVYIIQVGSYYYAFMVLHFQNGSTQTGVPATDKRYMTIQYKLIKIAED